MQRQCKICDNIYEATAKHQKKCEACKIPRGRPTYNPNAHKDTIDLKKLMILKKKIDRMKYEEVI